MTSTLEHPEEIHFIKGQGCIFVRNMEKQLGVVRIEMEFLYWSAL